MTRHEKSLHADSYLERTRSAGENASAQAVQPRCARESTESPLAAETRQPLIPLSDRHPDTSNRNERGCEQVTAACQSHRSAGTMNGASADHVAHDLTHTEHSLSPSSLVEIPNPGTFSSASNFYTIDATTSTLGQPQQPKPSQPQAFKDIDLYNGTHGVPSSYQDVDVSSWTDLDGFGDFSSSAFTLPQSDPLVDGTTAFHESSWDDITAFAQLYQGVPDTTSTPRAQQSKRKDSSSLTQALPQRLPSLSINNHVRDVLMQDLENRLGPDHEPKMRLPSAKLLDRFLGGYLQCFHPHYPILHLPTMDVTTTPAPLVLSVCAIGALYRLERRQAAILLQLADQAVRHVSASVSLNSS